MCYQVDFYKILFMLIGTALATACLSIYLALDLFPSTFKTYAPFIKSSPALKAPSTSNLILEKDLSIVALLNGVAMLKSIAFRKWGNVWLDHQNFNNSTFDPLPLRGNIFDDFV